MSLLLTSISVILSATSPVKLNPNPKYSRQVQSIVRAVLLPLLTCVRGVWGGGLYDRSAIIRHEQLARLSWVQRGEGWRARSSVPPAGPPGELQVQRLVQREHCNNLLTSHLHKQSGRDRVTPWGPKKESWLGFLTTCNDTVRSTTKQ